MMIDLENLFGTRLMTEYVPLTIYNEDLQAKNKVISQLLNRLIPLEAFKKTYESEITIEEEHEEKMAKMSNEILKTIKTSTND